MKEKILEFLKQQEGFISGQRICDELGISRTAVWKYMNSLKKEGYEIESVTRKGYRLLQSPDLLTREAVLSCIKKGEIPGELCCFESIDSTNEEAKRRGEAGAPDGSIYVADNQTNGKGRRGRTWLSPSGEDIFFTILLRPDLPLNSVSIPAPPAIAPTASATPPVISFNPVVIVSFNISVMLTTRSINGAINPSSVPNSSSALGISKLSCMSIGFFCVYLEALS